MKRILTIMLTLIMLLAALTGCIASQNQPISGADLFSQKKIQTITFSSDPNGYQYSFNGSAVQKICDFFSSLSFTIDESPDPSDVTGMGWDMTISYEDEHSETIVFPPNRTYLLKNSTKYKLTSNAVIEIDTLIDELKENQTYHSSCLLTIAETLPSCLAFEYKDEKPYCFYAYDTEGHLYRVLWNDFTGLNEKDVVVVDHNDDIKKLDYVNPPGGWTPQYEVTATGIKMEKRANDYLALHIQIKSGNNTIHPFGCMTWSKIDNDDGTFSESFVDKYDVIDLVSGKTPFAITDIPKLVLNDKVSYFVQVNGRVEKVYLLTPNDDTYTKSETTFDALSKLANGTYYVVLEVLLSGNCDPDAPQNSYRYEDVFCLVVGEQKPTNQNSILIESLNFSQYLNDVNFVPGLSQGSFIHKVEGYAYNDTAVTDIIAGMNYDGPSGGGWQATGDLFGFYNDYKVTDDEKYANYSNSLYSNVQLKGLPLPYNIKFGDSLDDVFEVIGIGLDQYGNFTPDKNSDTDITLYSNDTETLLFQNLKLTKEPVDYEFPFVLTYTETYNVQQDGGKSIVVHRVIKLSFDDDANFGLVEISVNETRELE